MTLRTLNYGDYGIVLIMGHAGFCPSTVGNGGMGYGDYYWGLYRVCYRVYRGFGV